MAWSAFRRPFWKICACFPEEKEELEVLPKEFIDVLALYAENAYINEDDFRDMMTICYEVASVMHKKAGFKGMAIKKIDEYLYEKRQEERRLYNPYKNLFLDKCYGDSKVPLGVWMDFSKNE